MSEQDLISAIDDYHDNPMRSSARHSALGTFEAPQNEWSSHSQLRAISEIVKEAAGSQNVSYSTDELSLYIMMTENVACDADRLLDPSLSGSKYNRYRFEIIENLSFSLHFAPLFYERLLRLVAFAKSKERDCVCNALRTGRVSIQDSDNLFDFCYSRSGKLFPENKVLSCLNKAHEHQDHQSMLLNTFKIDVTSPDAIKNVEARIGASAGSSAISSVPETDLAPMLPVLSFSNESVKDPVWPKKPKKPAAAGEPKKPKKPAATRGPKKSSTWVKNKLLVKEPPLLTGLKCENEGCINVAKLSARCAGMNCQKALCNACDQKSEVRYICDDCKPVTTGGYLSVDTHPVRQTLFHMFHVDDKASRSVTEYFRTVTGESCAIKTAKGAGREHAHPRSSIYLTYNIDKEDGHFQASITTQYETLVQARNEGANGKMHAQLDQLVDGNADVVYPKIEYTAIDQIMERKVNTGKCVIELL